MWLRLLKRRLRKGDVSNVHVIEVGMHRITWCAHAAELGFQAHCFEPSPTNFERCQKQHERLRRVKPETYGRIHLYNKAVGETSGITVPFRSVGSTGDHVGAVQLGDGKAEPGGSKGETLVKVSTISLDDFVGQLPTTEELFLIKIDTQGYEAQVFSGMAKLLDNARPTAVISEWWPAGMQHMAHPSFTPQDGTSGKTGGCVGTQV